LSLIQLPVDARAGVDVADNTGMRPIQYARLRLRPRAVEVLEHLGARPDSLRDAVNAGDVARVQVILAEGAEVDEPIQENADAAPTGLSAARSQPSAADRQQHAPRLRPTRRKALPESIDRHRVRSSVGGAYRWFDKNSGHG
jgi:hypothetical protein